MKRALALLLLPSVAFAGDLFLKSKTIDVVGVSPIAKDNLAMARQRAIADAQRNAVEQVLGTAIESTFSATQRETLKGKHSQFVSDVSARVKTKTTGFIDGYTVVSENREKDTLRVRLKVKVKAESLQAELRKLQDLLSAVGRPKIMILAAEHHTQKSGKKLRVHEPTVTALIEGGLIKRGFPLVDKNHKPDHAAITKAVDDPSTAAKVASDTGAEVAVVGAAEVEHHAHNAMGQGMFYTNARINLRAINVSTGQVLASFEATGKGVGASEELARVKAVKSAAPRAVDTLLGSLIQAWQGQLERGKRVVVSLTGVTSYGRIGRPFKKAVKSLEGVKKVKEQSFEKNTLTLEVWFSGTTDALLDLIFDEVAAQDRFTNLDRAGGTGDAIQLKL